MADGASAQPLRTNSLDALPHDPLLLWPCRVGCGSLSYMLLPVLGASGKDADFEGCRAKEGVRPMKITPLYLAALAPFAAIGYSGAYLGHAVVVVLTIGIFLGTLSLGRTSSSPPTEPPNARAS